MYNSDGGNEDMPATKTIPIILMKQFLNKLCGIVRTYRRNCCLEFILVEFDKGIKPVVYQTDYQQMMVFPGCLESTFHLSKLPLPDAKDK